MPAQGASSLYMPNAASCENSRKGEPGSSRLRTRSRGSNLPREVWRSRDVSPPPISATATFARKSATSAAMASLLVLNSAERVWIFVLRTAI